MENLYSNFKKNRISFIIFLLFQFSFSNVAFTQDCGVQISYTVSLDGLLSASIITPNGELTTGVSWQLDGSEVGVNSTLNYQLTLTRTYLLCAYYTVIQTDASCTGSTCTTFFYQGQQDPCEFAGNPTFNCVPYPSLPNGVAFFLQPNTNYNVTSINWDFGDGQTSTTYNPYNSYSSPGTYNVCVTVTYNVNGTSCTKQFCQTTTCAALPCDQFLANTNVFATFDGVSCSASPSFSLGTIQDVTWDFGDGQSQSGDPYGFYPHTYSNNGTYNVCATFTYLVSQTQQTCTKTVCDTITVGSSTGCDISANFTFTNENNTVTFSDNSTVTNGVINTYTWNFGDGNSATGSNISHQYTSPGQYIVCLTVNGVSNEAQPCSDTYCDTIEIGNCDGLTAGFNVVVNGATVTFTNTSTFIGGNIVQYTYDFDDTEFSGAANPVHTYQEPGTYTVCLTVKGYKTGIYCQKVFCTTIEIASPCGGLQVNFTCDGNSPMAVTNNTVFPGGAITSSVWDYGDGNTSPLFNPPPHAYLEQDAYVVCLTVTGTKFGAECTSTDCDICGDDCDALQASFTVLKDPTTGQYSFTDNSTFPNGTITETKIDFGDGSPTVTSVLPQTYLHNYDQNGEFMVCIVVKGTDFTGAECKDVYCELILDPSSLSPASCCENLNLDFELNPGPNGTLEFENQSQFPLDAANSFSWSFGNGQTFEGLNPPPAQNSELGDTICLAITSVKVNGELCVKAFCKAKNQVEACEQLFIDFASLEQGNNTEFNVVFEAENMTILNPVWFFGDGDSEVGISVDHQFINNENFPITLVITAITEDGDTCYKSLTKPRYDCLLQIGITENNALNFRYQPNPANETCIISFENVQERKIEMIDFSGRIVYSGMYTEQYVLLPVANLPNGLYVVNILNEEKTVGGHFLLSVIH